MDHFQKYIACLCIGMLVACGGKPEDTQTKAEVKVEEKTNNTELVLTEAQYKMANIGMGKPEMRTMSGSLKVSGKLDVPPQNLVSISAKTAGYLLKTDLLQGMSVKKGAVIATLQNPELVDWEQGLLEAKGKLVFATQELERQQLLAKENINAGKSLQSAISEVQLLQIRITTLGEKLRLLGIDPERVSLEHLPTQFSIYSPISGYVTKVNVNIGKYVRPEEVLFEIMDNAHLHAELRVYEKDLGRIKVGQSIRIQLPNETQPRMAKVYLIGKEIDNDRTVRVHAHLDREDAGLTANMFFSAFIETVKQEVVTLPQEAIVNFGDKSFVFLMTGREGADYKFRRIEVGTGISDGAFTEVVLPETVDIQSETMVTKGAYVLLSKMENAEEE